MNSIRVYDIQFITTDIKLKVVDDHLEMSMMEAEKVVGNGITGTGSDYVSGSNIATRIYHQTSGNPADDLWLDYSYILTDDQENFQIQMWNTTASAWGDVLGTQISPTLQWYNQTIVAGYITTNITIRYVGVEESSDITQSKLLIDYAEISAWNFSVNLIESTITITDYAQGSGNQSVAEIPLESEVSSGVTYTLQIRAVDGTGNPVTNNYLFFDNDSIVTGALQLTSSWQNIWTGQSPEEATKYFWVWLDVPFGVPDGTLTCTFYIRIIEV